MCAAALCLHPRKRLIRADLRTVRINHDHFKPIMLTITSNPVRIENRAIHELTICALLSNLPIILRENQLRRLTRGLFSTPFLTHVPAALDTLAHDKNTLLALVPQSPGAINPRRKLKTQSSWIPSKLNETCVVQFLKILLRLLVRRPKIFCQTHDIFRSSYPFKNVVVSPFVTARGTS